MSHLPPQPHLPHLDATVRRESPWGAYQFVDVTFPATPDTDLDVPHTLPTVSPSAIRYQVVSADRAVAVYHVTDGTTKVWTPTVIYLRADVASAACRLLLTLERA